MEEKKIFCICGCFSVSLTSKEVENHIFRYNCIFDTHEFFDNPHWEISGIKTLLFKYYSDISHALVGSFLNMLFLLLALILTELHEKLRKNKDWVTEKISKKNLCEGHHFFDYTPSFLCHFCCFLRLLSLPFQVMYLLNGPTHDISMDGILRDDIMSEWSKMWKSLAI